MAVYKNYSITLDTVRSPKMALQNIVTGETGVKLTITLTNGGSTVSLNGTNHRVCLRVDSSKGTRRQDSGLSNSGISFSDGKAVILLSRDTFATGQNRACLEIFSTETETNDTLIVSAEFLFAAKKNDSGENAGSVYPSLIVAEQEAAAATAAANEAAEAANSAASTATNAATAATNAAAAAIAATPVLLNVSNVSQVVAGKQWNVTVSENAAVIKATHSDGNYKRVAFNAKLNGDTVLHFEETGYHWSSTTLKISGIAHNTDISDYHQRYGYTVEFVVGDSVSINVYAANYPTPASYNDDNPVMDGIVSRGTSLRYARADHVHPSDTSKQDVLTFDNSPTANSNNPVKSSGVYTALAGKQNTLTFDDTPTQNSANPVKSGGVYTALAGKQSTLTFDNVPTASSNNPVKSGGVFSALDSIILHCTSASRGQHEGTPVQDIDGIDFTFDESPADIYGLITDAPTKRLCFSFDMELDDGNTYTFFMRECSRRSWTIQDYDHYNFVFTSGHCAPDTDMTLGANYLFADCDISFNSAEMSDLVTSTDGSGVVYNLSVLSDNKKADVNETPLIISLYNATWSTDPSTGLPAFSSSSFSGTALPGAALSSTNRRPIMLWVESPDTSGEYLLLVEHRRSGDSSHMIIDLMSAYDGDHTYATATIDVYPSDDTQHTTTVTGLWSEIYSRRVSP